MQKTLKKWVTFSHPGSFMSETTSRNVNSFDPHAIEWPPSAYAFAFYQREDVIDGSETYVGKAEQVGPTYYHPNTEKYDIEGVKRFFPEATILISNMECNGYEYVVKCRAGNWQPYNSNECVIL